MIGEVDTSTLQHGKKKRRAKTKTKKTADQKQKRSGWWCQPHLKNMLVKMGSIFPNFRGENSQNVWNHHPVWLSWFTGCQSRQEDLEKAGGFDPKQSNNRWKTEKSPGRFLLKGWDNILDAILETPLGPSFHSLILVFRCIQLSNSPSQAQTVQPNPSTYQSNKHQTKTIRGREWHGNGNGFGRSFCTFLPEKIWNCSRKILNKNWAAKVHPHTHRSQQPQTSDLTIDADGTFPSKVNQLDRNMSVKSSISKGHLLRFVQLQNWKMGSSDLLTYSIGTLKHWYCWWITTWGWYERGLSHYLPVFIHPRWCRISSVNSSILLRKQLQICTTHLPSITSDFFGGRRQQVSRSNFRIVWSTLWDFMFHRVSSLESSIQNSDVMQIFREPRG